MNQTQHLNDLLFENGIVNNINQNIINNQNNGLFSSHAIIVCLLIISIYFLKKYTSGPTYNTTKHNLQGKFAIVTGGNSGIGKCTVLQLIKLNCTVIIAARDTNKSQSVLKQATQIISSNKIHYNNSVYQFYLDLGSKQSIKQFSKKVHQNIPKIDYLINNAGVSLISKKTQTTEGFQIMYGVNHLGHFYLTSLLMDLLQKSQFFRIINVSSMAHKRLLGFGPKLSLDWDNLNFTKENSYQHNLAYSRSKLCNVLFAKALSRRIPRQRGLAVSLHPGVVQSQITRHQPFLTVLIKIVFPIFWLFTKNSWQGAQTTLFTILDRSVESGEYYSDCKKDEVNQFVLQQKNVQKLWMISEKDLDIKFQIKF